MRPHQQPGLGKLLLSYITGILVEKQPSQISGQLEVWLQNGRYVLHSLYANYSFDTLHRAFRHTFTKIHLQKKNPRTVLILGFGAGSVASILHREWKQRPHITGVELDETVIQLAHKYFRAGEYANLQIIHGNAVEFVQACHEVYELVVSDVFVHTEVPAAALDRDYLLGLVRLTSAGGTGIINLITETPLQQERAARVHAVLQQHVSRVQRIAASDVNTMLVWEV
jgi:spermidine synthase